MANNLFAPKQVQSLFLQPFDDEDDLDVEKQVIGVREYKPLKPLLTEPHVSSSILRIAKDKTDVGAVVIGIPSTYVPTQPTRDDDDDTDAEVTSSEEFGRDKADADEVSEEEVDGDNASSEGVPLVTTADTNVAPQDVAPEATAIETTANTDVAPQEVTPEGTGKHTEPTKPASKYANKDDVVQDRLYTRSTPDFYPHYMFKLHFAHADNKQKDHQPEIYMDLRHATHNNLQVRRVGIADLPETQRSYPNADLMDALNERSTLVTIRPSFSGFSQIHMKAVFMYQDIGPTFQPILDQI